MIERLNAAARYRRRQALKKIAKEFGGEYRRGTSLRRPRVNLPGDRWVEARAYQEGSEAVTFLWHLGSYKDSKAQSMYLQELVTLLRHLYDPLQGFSPSLITTPPTWD